MQRAGAQQQEDEADLDEDRPAEGAVEEVVDRGRAGSTDWTIPPSSSATTAASASVEKRGMTAARSRVRVSGASARVAAGSAATSTTMPPIQAPAARTCRTLAGSRIATGDCTPACPPSAGRKARARTGSASAATTARDRAGRRPRRRAWRAAGPARRRGRAAASAITAIQASDAQAPHEAEAGLEHRVGLAERGPDGGSAGRGGLQRECGERGERAGDAAAIRSSGRRRRAKAADAASHAATRSPGATHTAARRPGSQASRSRASAPRPRAMAPYSTPRATANATEVTGPASWPASSSSTVAAGAAPVPTLNTKPPEIGCESAETTRYVAV